MRGGRACDVCCSGTPHENVVAAKLTGDDSPTASEHLKLFLSVDAETEPEALRW
jgi:hypothetical protein